MVRLNVNNLWRNGVSLFSGGAAPIVVGFNLVSVASPILTPFSLSSYHLVDFFRTLLSLDPHNF